MYLSLFGAVVAFSLAIYLIIKKVPPVYAMMLGAFFGGMIVVYATPELLSAGLFNSTINIMVSGSQSIMSSVLRILAAGILAGFLIESKSAESIANYITTKLGAENALLALALSTMILTSVGVFVDIAIITVAPIGLALAKKSDISRIAILVAMIGGGKCGNIMSANPNTIAVSEAFNVSLTQVMIAGIIPAIIGLIATVLISRRLTKKGSFIDSSELVEIEDNIPGIIPAITGPVVVIVLLALRPLFGIAIDPIIALPLGGIVGCYAVGHQKHLVNYAQFGLNKMSGVAIMLIGTGALAGVIKASSLAALLTQMIQTMGLPPVVLAPLSGALMSFATASTTAGASTAAAAFGPAILAMGIGGVAAAAMINASATMLDHMPHGSFFHATSGAVNMEFKEMLKVVPYATLIGVILTLSSVILFLIVGVGA